MRKQEMWPLTDEEIESYNNRKFCHICKKKCHDVNDNNDDCDDYSYDDEETDARKFDGDAAGFDDVHDNYCNYDDSGDEFDGRKFHGVAAGPDDVADDNKW